MSAQLLALLEPLVEAVSARVVTKLATSDHNMVTQASSPLGPRRHRAVVKRRVENGEGGAAILGRRFLLTRSALDEELARGKTPRPVAKAKPRSDELDAFQRELMGGLARLREVR